MKTYDCWPVFSENDEEREALPFLDKPGWYSQGNAVHLYELLKKMTGKPEPKVFYHWGGVFVAHLERETFVN